ncbi:hypothetical protein B7R21_18975 [Subtercola boreus]|uniref:DNA recombination protein RecN n=2 Tax=Subtercola boreus TaxID=120213 RepID=A0A3E0VAX8_9MICO|nr:hypothetical protein B7R21_18975 [Subtercola boreus]
MPADAKDGFRALSVISGQSQTGKTTIVDFILYALGDNRVPRHDEVRSNVRAALLELDLGDEPIVIERATIGGEASSFASIWSGHLDTLDPVGENRVAIEPTSDPSGLSQLILSSMNLDEVLFPDSSVKEDTNTSMMSIRDLFRVFVVRNERLDNKDLVYEHGNYMVAQKYRQTIDVIFGVHDNEGAILAAQARAASERLRTAEGRLSAMAQIAERDYPEGRTQLQINVDDASLRIAELNAQLRVLDADQRSSQTSSARLRVALRDAQTTATESRVRVRDRKSLLDRLDALRGQYADDQRKLAFLVDAEVLFDPLRVTVCPACFNTIAPVTMDGGHCSLCHSPVELHTEEKNDDDAGVDLVESAGSSPMVRSELRAVRGRLSSLADYIGRLTVDLDTLERRAEQAELAAVEAAAAVDAITQAPAPWLALRDQMTGELTGVRLLHQASATGLRSWARVDEEEQRVVALRNDVEQLRGARKRGRPDRDAILRQLASRFGSILEDIGYPKLRDPYIDGNLVPYVRGLPYTEASSGGMVIIALAWNLALWEIAFEQDADAPGLLIIDSPQKNLGHNSAGDDEEFADAQLVERFYAHVKTWLATDGIGAQAIIVDNSPPSTVANDVVVNFTRNPNMPPYGLIHDAVS